MLGSRTGSYGGFRPYDPVVGPAAPSDEPPLPALLLVLRLGRQRRHEPRRIDRAPTRCEVVARSRRWPGDSGERDVAERDVDDAGAAAAVQPVQSVVDVAQPVMLVLRGESNDAGEQRRGLTRTADDVPADARWIERV